MTERQKMWKEINAQIQRLRKEFPEGTRVEVIEMQDEYDPVPAGTRGTVFWVDDIGNINVEWDNGQTLSLVYGEDKFRKVREEK